MSSFADELQKQAEDEGKYLALAAGVGAAALGYKKLKPKRLGKPFGWAQALDNTSPDIHFRGGRPTPEAGRTETVSRISRFTVKSKPKVQGAWPSKTYIWKRGKDAVIELGSDQLDEAGRASGAIIMLPGGAQLSRDKLVGFAKRYATKMTDRTFTKVSAVRSAMTLPRARNLLRQDAKERLRKTQPKPRLGFSFSQIEQEARKPTWIKKTGQGYDPKRVREVQRSLDAFMKKNKLTGTPVVLAGTSMYLQGLRPTLKDIDVHIPGMEGFKEEKHKGFVVDAGGEGPKRWSRNAVDIGGVKAQSIPDLIKFKKEMGRPKDKRDIKVLEERLNG